MTNNKVEERVKHLATVSEVVALRRILAKIREDKLETFSEVRGAILNDLEELGFPYEENIKTPF